MFRLALIAAILVLVSGKNVVKDCGPDDAYIKFHKLDITPMPLNILGFIKVDADIETLTRVGSEVSLSVNLKKSNLGNSFTWEVPCTNIGIIGDAAQGFTGYMGTCDYKGSCDFPFIKTWIADNSCPKFFADYNLPCQCPFPPVSFSTSTPVEIDLEQFKNLMPSWLIEGGYKVRAELKDTTNNNKLVGCLEMDIDVNARKPCPAVLKKLNACPKDYQQ
ncbi:ganglioside GM2 activator-like [Watersipora subatra]|uniref:ganglioside GM2 activator-like n=1 Tax=Watersipora subatra TaxID=2589382 RepID=UPI00355B019E